MSSAETSTARGSDYAELSRQIKRAGLLDRRPGYYVVKIALNTVLLAAGWWAFVVVGDSWYQLGIAAYLAVVFTQVAFVGHDAGHRQILRSRRANELVGLLHGNLLIGMSYGWWVGKHNRHHAHPNDEDRDPDIGAGALVFTPEQARTRRGLARALARSQAYLFFPMLFLEAANLHLASVRALLGRRTRSLWSLEAALLAVHAAGYLTAVLLVLGPVKAVAFIAVQQGLFGLYLGCSFAPNHKGMPVLDERTKRDYLRRQVLTSRNVRGGRIIGFVLGGLNYQIEHHLFPSMPRPSLPRCREVVRAFCLQHDLPYSETTLLRSYTEVLRHLHTVATPQRPATADAR